MKRTVICEFVGIAHPDKVAGGSISDSGDKNFAQEIMVSTTFLERSVDLCFLDERI